MWYCPCKSHLFRTIKSFGLDKTFKVSLPVAVGWNQMILKVSSNPKPFHDKIIESSHTCAVHQPSFLYFHPLFFPSSFCFRVCNSTLADRRFLVRLCSAKWTLCMKSWRGRPRLPGVKGFTSNSRCCAYVECKSGKEGRDLEALWRSRSETGKSNSSSYQSRCSFYFLHDSTEVLTS